MISIGSFSFTECNGLTSVKITDSVTTIENEAFRGCANLTSIDLGDSITSIGSAFGFCTSLTSITIPNSVTYIGDYAFDACENLTSINYTGTQEQWNDISLGDEWNVYDCPEITVHCTDGDIIIPAS